MTSKNSRKHDGRGRSAGSRKTQFSKDNQPDRSAKRGPKRVPDVVEILKEAIYEKVRAKKGGRWVKIPFIEAFIDSMRKNAFSSKLVDQMKFLKELMNSGIFDIEEYKQKIFIRINNHFKELVKSYDRNAKILKDLGEEYKRVAILHIFYFLAYMISRRGCSCGACERGIDVAKIYLPIAMLRGLELLDDGDQVPADDHSASDDEEDDDVDAPVDGSTPSSSDAAADDAKPSSSSTDDDPDDEFYSGMGWD